MACTSRSLVPEEAIIPEELRAELDAWSQGNAEALAMIESLSRDADDVIRVGGTRVTLDTVVGAYRDGASAEEICAAVSLARPG